MNAKIIFSLCLSLVVGLATTNLCQAGLLSHWTFDETAEDSGPAGQDGTLVGTAGYTTTTQVAGSAALSLDGSGAVDISQANPMLHGLTTATLSAWVRVESFTENVIGDVPNIFSRDLTPATRDDTDRVEMNIDFRSNSPSAIDWRSFGIPSVGGAKIEYSTSGPFETLGEWHHLAIVFDAAAPDQTRMYTDGVLDDPGNTTGLTTADFDFAAIGGFTIDGGILTVRNNLVGAIDDVQIYGDALSADQVAFLYANPGATAIPEPATCSLLACGALVLLWHQRRG